MPDFESVIAHQKANPPSKERPDGEYQARAQVHVAEQFSQLVADPRWQTYVDHVEAARKGAEDRIKGLEFKLHQVLPHDEYVKTICELREQKAYALAYSIAITMVSTLIEKGEGAMKELKDE